MTLRKRFFRRRSPRTARASRRRRRLELFQRVRQKIRQGGVLPDETTLWAGERLQTFEERGVVRRGSVARSIRVVDEFRFARASVDGRRRFDRRRDEPRRSSRLRREFRGDRRGRWLGITPPSAPPSAPPSPAPPSSSTAPPFAASRNFTRVVRAARRAARTSATLANVSPAYTRPSLLTTKYTNPTIRIPVPFRIFFHADAGALRGSYHCVATNPGSGEASDISAGAGRGRLHATRLAVQVARRGERGVRLRDVRDAHAVVVVVVVRSEASARARERREESSRFRSRRRFAEFPEVGTRLAG